MSLTILVQRHQYFFFKALCNLLNSRNHFGKRNHRVIPKIPFHGKAKFSQHGLTFDDPTSSSIRSNLMRINLKEVFFTSMLQGHLICRKWDRPRVLIRFRLVTRSLMANMFSGGSTLAFSESGDGGGATCSLLDNHQGSWSSSRQPLLICIFSLKCETARLLKKKRNKKFCLDCCYGSNELLHFIIEIPIVYYKKHCCFYNKTKNT